VKPKAVVFICHGYGEHIGRYEHVAAELNSQGYAVYGMDHQGHGQSEGDRAHVEDFNHFARDYLDFVRIIQQQLSRPIPCFLLGHSMGGLISTQVVRKSSTEKKEQETVWPWAGLVLSAPAIVPDPSVAKPWMVAVAGFFSKVTPQLPFEKLNAKWTSRDPVVVWNYEHDPLNYHGGVRARLGMGFLEAMTDAQRHAGGGLSLPLLIIQGDMDKLVIPSGAQLLYDRSVSADKTLRMYPGNYHELFNEFDKAQVLGDVVSWLDKHIPS